MEKLGDQIVHLDFTGNLEFTDADLAKVAQVATLTHLDLSGTGITAAGLAHLKNHPALKSLKLDGCPVTGGLEALNQTPGLVTLHVTSAGLTDADMKAVATIETLTELRIGENTITNNGVRELAAMPNLRVIDLHETKITDTALVHLQRMPVIAEIDLRGCQVGKTLLARFEQLMPRTTLHTGEYEAPQPEPPATVAAAQPMAPRPPQVAQAPVSVPRAERPPPAPVPGGSGGSGDSVASINATQELFRAESKMRRTAMQISSYAFHHRAYPDSVRSLVNGRLFELEDALDYWEEQYDYFGKGMRYDPFDHLDAPRRMILATAQPHHGYHLVLYTDDRIERMTEEAYRAARAPRR